MNYLNLDGDEFQVGADYAGNAVPVPGQQIKARIKTADDG